MNKTALITGITGQDASYLCELLHEKGYKIFGLIRGQNNPKRNAFEQQFPYVTLIEGDMLDSGSLLRALQLSEPDEIYNLAAVSFVGYSFISPELTTQINGVGVIKLLDAIRFLGMEKKVRLYQASTSELFGEVREVPQTENTPFYPRSPYGFAKALAHYAVVNYRESYGMHASCGILFNHESPRRGLEFVTRKVSKNVAQIKLGKTQRLFLGNINVKRDWGYSKDYVEGMWLMLQQDKPDDYVFASGETHTIEDLVKTAFEVIGIKDWKNYVEIDKSLFRPADVSLLKGDYSKAQKILGWEPKTTFEDLIKMMVENDLDIESSAL